MKKIPYATQWIGTDDVSAVDRALRSPYLTQGPRVKEFEEKVANYCGAKYAVAVNSGTSALHAACFAAGIGAGDEVITSPITFVASANSVLYCGGRPVFADVEPDTINLDPAAVTRLITGKTRAIMPVHFAGHPCDLAALRKIAAKHKLLMIEDAAHALGAEYRGSKIGAGKYSDLTVLSFHAVKHITTGEGGMVLTNDAKLYQNLLRFRTHGITRDKQLLTRPDEGPWYYEMHDLGYNYRITDFQCALGTSQIKKLDRFVKRRRELAGSYDRALQASENLVLPVEKASARSAYHLYVVRVKEGRRRVFEALVRAGVGVNVHYLPVYFQPYYKKLGYRTGTCPVAEKYYEQAITLPLFPKMTDDDARRVIKAVLKVAG